MADWTTLAITGIGIIMTFIVLTDIYLTVLHVDREGHIASATFGLIWKATMALARTFPSARRSLIAHAGPAMIVALFIMWVTLFIIGFALIYLPYMDLFRATREFTYLGFFDALYFSGVTATVLGYGDITPMSDTLQIVSFLQSGFGFAILTCVVTYIISVVSGVTDRNILSLRMWTETDRTGDGVLTVIQALSDEEPVYFRLRLQTLLDNVYHIQPKMQQFPILDIFYRSKDPVFSPEIMIRSVTELAIAAQIVSADPKHRGLKTSAEKLGEASVEIMKLITLQYLSKQARSRLKNPVFEKEDEARLEQIWSRLTQALPDLQLENAPHNKQTLQTIYRLRIFLNEMKHFSEWDRDEL